MLKLRLKRIGRKRAPSYRLVLMESTTRRDGRPIEQLGWYDPIAKKHYMDTIKLAQWLKCGVQPTPTVLSLLRKAKIVQN